MSMSLILSFLLGFGVTTAFGLVALCIIAKSLAPLK